MKRLTALKAIRLRCLDCSGGSSYEVKNCPCNRNEGVLEKCPLYPFRFGKRPKEKQPIRPTRAIRLYCLWCFWHLSLQVKECPTMDCPLYRFRFGKNPNYHSRVIHRKEEENAEN